MESTLTPRPLETVVKEIKAVQLSPLPDFQPENAPSIYEAFSARDKVVAGMLDISKRPEGSLRSKSYSGEAQSQGLTAVAARALIENLAIAGADPDTIGIDFQEDDLRQITHETPTLLGTFVLGDEIAGMVQDEGLKREVTPPADDNQGVMDRFQHLASRIDVLLKALSIADSDKPKAARDMVSFLTLVSHSNGVEDQVDSIHQKPFSVLAAEVIVKHQLGGEVAEMVRRKVIEDKLLRDEYGFPNGTDELAQIKELMLQGNADKPLRMAENLTTLDEDQRKGLNLRKILEQVINPGDLRVLATNGHVSIYALRVPQATPPTLDMIVAVGPDCQPVVLDDITTPIDQFNTSVFNRTFVGDLSNDYPYSILTNGIVTTARKEVDDDVKSQFRLVYIGNDGEIKKGPEGHLAKSGETRLPDGSLIVPADTIDKDYMAVRKWYKLDHHHDFVHIQELDFYSDCGMADDDPQSPSHFFINPGLHNLLFADNHGRFQSYFIPPSLRTEEYRHFTITTRKINSGVRSKDQLYYLPLYPRFDHTAGNIGILAIENSNGDLQMGLCSGNDNGLLQEDTPFTNLGNGLIVYEAKFIEEQRTLRLIKEKDGKRMIWVRDETRLTDNPDQWMDYNTTVRTILRRMAADTPGIESILEKGTSDYCHPTQRIDDLYTTLYNLLGSKLLHTYIYQEESKSYPNLQTYDTRLLPPLKNTISSSLKEIRAELLVHEDIYSDFSRELTRRLSNLTALLNALPQ